MFYTLRKCMFILGSSDDSENESDFMISEDLIRNEEKMIEKMRLYTDNKQCKNKINFKHAQIQSILEEICQNKRLNLNDEKADEIVMMLSLGLESKLTAILQRATLFVHNRLRKLDLLGQTPPNDSIEKRIQFVENAYDVRAQKQLEGQRPKCKKEEKKQKAIKINLEKQEKNQSYTNNLLMSALNGTKKIEDISLVNPKVLVPIKALQKLSLTKE
ncbi:hypothetical protein RF11_00498 [Thelohanellus kitauei]|uniref:Transcription initiation factor TFIID subunit 4 n=1 Tax=Thelohanellus kitauei TaxID=669202 RepID=A0A0C2N403_THEKT|nr:hypothetical protein RF11_00498 [Thelohanellus kitauei]